ALLGWARRAGRAAARGESARLDGRVLVEDARRSVAEIDCNRSQLKMLTPPSEKALAFWARGNGFVWHSGANTRGACPRLKQMGRVAALLASLHFPHGPPNHFFFIHIIGNESRINC